MKCFFNTILYKDYVQNHNEFFYINFQTLSYLY